MATLKATLLDFISLQQRTRLQPSSFTIVAGAACKCKLAIGYFAPSRNRQLLLEGKLWITRTGIDTKEPRNDVTAVTNADFSSMVGG